MSILDGPGPVQQPQQPAQPQQSTSVSDPLNPQPQQQSGFLNDLGVNWDDVSTSNDPPDGTHHCFVVKSEIRTRKSDQSKHWVFTYKIAEGESHQGRTKDEWRAIPVVNNGKFASERDEQNAGWLKQRLLSLGVPEDRIGVVTPIDVQGTEVYVTLVTKTTTKGTFQNVTNVRLFAEVQGQLNGGAQQQTGTVQGLI